MRKGQNVDEGGALLVLWTLAIVSILLFSALAIDLGNIAQTKQHSQDAIDAGTVSAVGDLSSIFTNSSSYALYEQQAVTDLENYVNENDASVSSGDWTDPTKCPSGVLQADGAPAFVWTSTQSNCIGFFNPGANSLSISQTDPTGIAAVEPTRTVNYTLGKAGGLTNQKVSAIAYSSIQTAVSNNVLPFGYAAGGSQGLQCLKTGSASTGCSGFATGSGNYGLICSPRFSLFVAGGCSSGNDPIIDSDLAIGLDHVLHCYTSTLTPNACNPGAGQIVDYYKSNIGSQSTNWCAPYDNANYANPQTGQTDAIMTSGLYAGFTASFQSSPGGACGITNGTGTSYTFSPRLNHADGDSASSTSSGEASPTAISCYTSTNTSGVPCLLSADILNSSYTSLNGQHITNFLIPTSGSTDPRTNSLFTDCFSGTEAGGGTPNPAVDPIDEVVGGTNAWVTGDLTGASSSCTGGLSSYLNNPSNANTQIFSASIEQSPRFGIVPVINTTGSGPVPIQGFEGIYFDNGFPKKGNGSSLDSILAWVFPISMIQDVNLGNSSGFGSFVGGPFVANLCDLPAGNC